MTDVHQNIGFVETFLITAVILLGFCTLCFYFPTKMLHLNAPFFPLKCSVSSQKVTKMHAWLILIHRVS